MATLNGFGTLTMSMTVAGAASDMPFHGDGGVILSRSVAGTASGIPFHGDGGVILSRSVAGAGSGIPFHGNGGVILSRSVAGTASIPLRFTMQKTLPMLTITGAFVQGSALLTDVDLPMLTITGAAKAGSVYTLDQDLPMLTIVAQVNPGAQLTLPALSITAAAAGGTVATLDKTLPALSITAAARDNPTATASNTLPQLTIEGSAANGFIYRADVDLPVIRLSAACAAGSVATADVDLPAAYAESAGRQNGIITAASMLPSMNITGVLYNPTIVDTEVLSMNVENYATTRYTNFNFLYLGRFNGTNYGVKSDGVYSLTGSTDAGTAIPAAIKTGMEDFGSEFLKRVDQIYVGYEADGDMNADVTIDGDAAARSYPLRRKSHDAGVSIARITPAHGLKSRYWQIGMTNVDGADFEIDSLGVLDRQLERKTRRAS